MANTKGATETSQLVAIKPDPHRGIAHHLRAWSYESLAFTIAFLSLACLVVTLHEFDGQRQDNWKYTHITRNTVIAAIATVARTSLLTSVTISLSQNKWAWFSNTKGVGRRLNDLRAFDDASRGATGSLRLLRVAKWRHIGALGAFVVIFALPFDTFAQNVLGYEFRNQPFGTAPDKVGSIPRTEIFGSTYSVPTMDWFTFDIPFKMKAAISSGVLGLESSIPAPLCSTGNCTWPAVPSLAMCGQCMDVTSSVHSNCSSAGWSCDYTLPDGSDLAGPRAGVSQSEVPDAPIALLNVSATTANLYNSGAAHKERIYAGHMSFIQSEVKGLNSGDGLKATQCDLWFCVQTYNISVENGVQKVTTMSMWDAATSYNQTIGQTGEDFTSVRNFTNITDPATDSDTVFSVSYANAKAISVVLQDLVTGTVSYSGNRGAYLYSSDSVQSIWESRHNLSAWLDIVISSLTTALRSNATVSDSSISADKYRGSVTSTESFVKVRWVWILYPAALLVLGFVHFAGTLWQTVHSGMHAWKSNPLVLLRMHLAMEDGQVATMRGADYASTNDQNHKAVLLYDENEGWGFSTVESAKPL